MFDRTTSSTARPTLWKAIIKAPITAGKRGLTILADGAARRTSALKGSITSCPALKTPPAGRHVEFLVAKSKRLHHGNNG